MKTYILLVAIAIASAQQYQRQTAVRLASPGFFPQGGSFSSDRSFINSKRNNNQFQSGSLEDQGSNLQSGAFVGNRGPGQYESFQTRNEFQSGSSPSFSPNSQTSFTSFDSSQNQFRQRQPTSFFSSRFQQGNNNRIQSTTQSSSGNRFQNTFRLQNTDSHQFKNPFNQRSTESRFKSMNIQLTPFSRFQDSSNQQITGSSFRTHGDEFQQTNFNQQSIGSSFQRNTNTRSSSGNQPQLNNRFSSGSQTQQGGIISSVSQSLSTNRFSPSSQSFSPSGQTQSNIFQRADSGFSSGGFSNAKSDVFEPLNLPSGASLLLGSIDTGFSCVNRPYGYYADQDNSCRIFHVCNPALFSSGKIQTYQYSFMCGEGTIFDQNELTCKMAYDATPCQDAPNYYSRNEEFGRPEEKSF
ncbi:hypothetical protein SK128_004555 [Halocaridina rubra]|uniref:Chitin-binding type-2 domain-containing protein n=1 Tax=Halocaridina rubra TaxID=373956 RepID=A0AAN8WAX4_HALRR